MIDATQCFISYTRHDNDDFDQIVDKLARSIANVYEGQTGNALEIFLDRESIGWGEDWRARIRLAIENATLFIPIITMRYFRSAPCTEELLAFYSNARQLGVTELILPLVVMGADRITSTDPRETVQLIEGLNYKNIQATWVAGSSSPEWRATVLSIASDIEKAIDQTETRLLGQHESVDEREVSPPPDSGSGPSDGGSKGTKRTPPDEESSADLFDLLDKFGKLHDSLQDLKQPMEEFEAAASVSINGVDWPKLDPERARRSMLNAAKQLEGPSKNLGIAGAQLLTVAVDCDGVLRALVEDLRRIGEADALTPVASMLTSVELPPELVAMSEQLGQLISGLKQMSILNLSLRTSLRPAIRAIEDIRTAFSTFSSWQTLRSF
jgi:hypothetical protein